MCLGRPRNTRLNGNELDTCVSVCSVLLTDFLFTFFIQSSVAYAALQAKRVIDIFRIYRLSSSLPDSTVPTETIKIRRINEMCVRSIRVLLNSVVSV